MQASYGGYHHDRSEADFRVITRTMRGSNDRAYSILQDIYIDGELQADTQAQLFAKIRALELAYSKDGRDFIVTSDAGVISPTTLRNGQTLGGVQVIAPPSYRTTAGDAEYGTHRTYHIHIRGEVKLTSSNVIIEWGEGVQLIGDSGPLTAHHPVVKGAWPKQQLSERSLMRAVQSGRAVGLLDYPPPAVPLVPGAINRNVPPRIGFRGPRERLFGRTHFTTTWSYFMEQNAPFAIRPTLLRN